MGRGRSMSGSRWASTSAYSAAVNMPREETMNKNERNERMLAEALVREAKHITDPRRLFEIAATLDSLSAYVEAAQIRMRAKQLNDNLWVTV